MIWSALATASVNRTPTPDLKSQEFGTTILINVYFAPMKLLINL
jgi:hypothetical protein